MKSNKLSFSSDLGKNKAVKFWPFPSVKCLQMVSGRSWCIHCSDGLQQGSSWVGNEKGNDLVKLCETCCWFLAWNEYCSLAPGAAPRVSVKTMGLILCVCFYLKELRVKDGKWALEQSDNYSGLLDCLFFRVPLPCLGGYGWCMFGTSLNLPTSSNDFKTVKASGLLCKLYR